MRGDHLTAETPPLMTARERVLVTIDHREPDRLAVDLGSTPSSGISAVAHANLVRHLGLARPAHPRLRRGPAAGPALRRAPRSLPHRRHRHRPHLQHRRRGLEADDAAERGGRRDPGVVPPGPPGERTPGRPSHDDGLRIASMPLGANFFDQTHFPYLDGYPDDLSDLPSVMPTVLWSGSRPQPLGPRRRRGLLGDAARSRRWRCAPRPTAR